VIIACVDNGDEKSEYDVIAKSFTIDNRIQAIRTIKEILNVGLFEAKEFIDSLPKMVFEGASRDHAKVLKLKLESAGIRIEIK
jgi:large subunit ribosomal protein L7/L12